MATEFIMPRLPDHQPHLRFFPHHHSQPQSRSTSPTYASAQIMAAQQPHSQQVSPMGSSTNGSPTASSPISHHNQRLRPLYIPAVLRPNEYPSKPKKAEDPDQSSLQSSNSSLLNVSGWGAQLGRLTRRSTGDSGKFLDDDEDDLCSWAQWQLDLFAKPTAQPTRQHWKADSDSAMCDEPSCTRRFNYFVRRHHCRRCGNIFCDTHSPYSIPLDEDASFNPKGTDSRSCAHCYMTYRAWCSQASSDSDSDNGTMVLGGSQTAPASPIASALPAGIKGRAKHPAEVALSVPRDWNWSTF